VLVLAPHPDDEAVGLGGTLAWHGEQGDSITVIFVCSGIAGDPEGYFEGRDLAAIRQEEARAAATVLGIGDLRFLGYPDNLSEADFDVFEGLPDDPEEQRRTLVRGFAGDLERTLESESFDIVYHPWEKELNPDHWAIGQAVVSLIGNRPDLAARISFMGYEVWSPLPPETVIDVSDVIAKKVDAIRCYQSQLFYVDYESRALGVSAYRSILLERGAVYGEAFRGRYREPSK
jgi:LmbE family N-acetylglucosaminyl deacetylase